MQRFARLISPGSRVLDLACGAGRHSRLLHAAGLDVLAADRDTDALAALAAQGISTLNVDLENGPGGFTWPFADQSFAAVIVTNYLHRPLFPSILASLQPGGLLIYETFAIGNAAFGRPANPDFLLADAELLQQMQSSPGVAMHIVAYEQGYAALPKPAMVQRICARRAVSGGADDAL